MTQKSDRDRIVITGVGLAAPNGNNLTEFRQALLSGKSGISIRDVAHYGPKPAGVCNFDEFRHQKKKARKRGTRVGAFGVYCAHEALIDAGIDLDLMTAEEKSMVGIYVGITEHGNVETENELFEWGLKNERNWDFWSHHHNPRTVANAPAGEISLNLGITGPAYTIGAACAAGNMGIIHALQMIKAGEVDWAIGGGLAESVQCSGIFAAFNSQGALGNHEDVTMASRPLDKNRNGITVSEGGCLYIVETLERAKKRGAKKVYGEIIAHHVNSDATDFVLPNQERQAECIDKALLKAGLKPSDVDLVSMHATGTTQGDIQECKAIKKIFGDSPTTHINATKGFIGHCMGAAGSLELAGNLPSFDDDQVHPCKNITDLDPECAMDNLVVSDIVHKKVDVILNNSFGMLGINSTLIIKKYNHIKE
jgi:3-oxoacyl-[acyl-carrier-protein] synthase II